MRAKIKDHDQLLEIVAYSSKTFFVDRYGDTEAVIKPVVILKTREKIDAQLIVVDIEDIERVD